MSSEHPREKPAVSFGHESPTRCPFCHDAVQVAATDWIACRACLARHHVECWRERGQCASCRGTAVLVSGAPPVATGGPYDGLSTILGTIALGGGLCAVAEIARAQLVMGLMLGLLAVILGVLCYRLANVRP